MILPCRALRPLEEGRAFGVERAPGSSREPDSVQSPEPGARSWGPRVGLGRDPTPAEMRVVLLSNEANLTLFDVRPAMTPPPPTQEARGGAEGVAEGGALVLRGSRGSGVRVSTVLWPGPSLGQRCQRTRAVRRDNIQFKKLFHSLFAILKHFGMDTPFMHKNCRAKSYAAGTFSFSALSHVVW